MGWMVMCGVATMDWLASVDNYPQPDQKIRTTSLQKMGGGNAANAAVCIARLGIHTKIITKLGNDEIGSSVLQEFKDENIDTSLITQYNGPTPFSYIIIDTTNKSRTIINTPGKDLEEREVDGEKYLEGASLLFLDGRHSLAAKKLAKAASSLNIPVVLELENYTRPLIWDLIPFADFIVSSAAFPPGYLKQQQDAKQATNEEEPFQFLMTNCVRAKWLISTFGKKGSILIEKIQGQASESKSSLDSVINELIRKELPPNLNKPQIQSVQVKIKNESYNIYHCSIWPTDPSLIIDTTGAGDTFNGGILFSLLNKFSICKMLKFATYLAAENCKHIGGRGGMKKLKDINMSLFD